MADESKDESKVANLTDMSQQPRGQMHVTAGVGSLFLYGRGSSTVVRDAKNPAMAFVYQANRSRVTVASMSPCGKYVASGDDKGGVKVWTFSEPVTMYKELDGVVADAVVDLAWNASSTRLCVVGDNKKGRAVVVDLSSNEMVCSAAGSTDPYVLCAYSRTGDERVAFANNDATISIYGGDELPWEVPLKVFSDDSAKMYCMQFSPTAPRLVLGASNGCIHVYNTESFEKEGVITKAHGASGVYSVSFTSDGSQFLTHSADGNCKLWNADTRELVATFPMGKGRARMQVGGVITPDGPVVTLSKDGSFAFLDLESPDAAPSFIPSLDGPPSTLVGCPGDEPAVLVVFREGVMKYSVADAGLSAQLVLSGSYSKFAAGTSMFAGANRNTLTFGSLESGETSSTVELASQIVDVKGKQLGDNFVVAAITQGKQIVVLANGEQKSVTEIKYEPNVVDVASDGSRVVVGSENKMKVHTFLLNDDFTLTKNKATDPSTSPIVSVAISPDGKFIAYGDATKEVRVVDAETKKFKMIKGLWTNHKARITSLSWTPSSDLIASTGFCDDRVRSWDMATKKKSKVYRQSSAPIAVEWVDEEHFVCIDADGVGKLVTRKRAK